MKGVIIKYWWGFPLLLAFWMVVLILLCLGIPTFIENVVGVLLYLTLIGLVISWVVLLKNKKWTKCLLSFLISIAIIIFLGGYWTLVAAGSPDGFGKKHPIPEGLKYNLPIEWNTHSNVSIDSLDVSSFLQVWGEKGFYNYDFYYDAIPAGEVFLRCYEATKNIPLSEDKIAEASLVQIDSTFSFSQIVNQKLFTIFEGDYEDYYAARIEVWHRNAKTGEENKLLEKVYRVEGWMR